MQLICKAKEHHVKMFFRFIETLTQINEIAK